MTLRTREGVATAVVTDVQVQLCSLWEAGAVQWWHTGDSAGHVTLLGSLCSQVSMEAWGCSLVGAC